MNQPAYMDVGPGHMSHSSVTSAASAPGHYASYPQNGLSSYGSSPVSYGYNGYQGNMGAIPTAGSAPGPMGNHLVHQPSMSLPALATNTPAPASSQGLPGRQMDTTGQVAPPGMKPRVTATLWEDEGSLCFQVEAAGICVARREDNHMINGTKLLNVAGMTRGRRDGMLKCEKTRSVVKIGPMHLKGVWIPFERALEFANKEKITEQLYPLFVHNIGALLYHPQNQGGRTAVASAVSPQDRRREGQPDYMRTPQSAQQPTLQHHHSVTNPIGAHNQPAPHSITPHPASGRPGLDRAHTFPNPPSSASSIMGMGNAGSSYEWGGGAPMSVAPSTQPLSIDTGMTARSVPATPSSTPPANSIPSMSYQTSGPYDSSRSMYGHAPSSSFGSSYGGMPRYGQLLPSPGAKNEMGPPPRSAHEGDEKRDSMYSTHGNEHTQQGDEGDHEGDYTHSAGPYGQNRHAYAYHPHANAAAMNHDQSHPSPDVTGSPQKHSGRATPRTTNYAQNYNTTPQRSQPLPSSNLFNVMGEHGRNPSNGADMHAGPYVHSYASPNGLPPSNKRVYELDDDEQMNGLKRSKTMHDRNGPPMLSAQNNR